MLVDLNCDQVSNPIQSSLLQIQRTTQLTESRQTLMNPVTGKRKVHKGKRIQHKPKTISLKLEADASNGKKEKAKKTKIGLALLAKEQNKHQRSFSRPLTKQQNLLTLFSVKMLIR